MLAEVRNEFPQLKIHANTVAMSENLDEIRRLTEYLHDRCPAIEHHNLAIIRGDRKSPSLQGPQLQQYRELYQHIATVWADREEHRFGASVEPMLQWAKVKTIEAREQVVACKAGILSGVVYANGDVSVCETHPPLGNLRRNRFFEIWRDRREARPQILGARVAQRPRQHPELAGERLLVGQLPALGLFVGEHRERRDAHDRPVDDVAKLVRPQDDVERLVPRHVTQRDVNGALDGRVDDDVQAADFRERPEHRPEIGALEIEAHRVAAVARRRGDRRSEQVEA